MMIPIREFNTPTTPDGSEVSSLQRDRKLFRTFGGRSWNQHRTCWTCRLISQDLRSRSALASQSEHEFQQSWCTNLKALAQREQTSLFTLLLTAMHVWLHRYTGQNNIVVSSPVTRRSRPEFESIFGFFLNTLPICSHVEGEQTFTEALTQLKQTLIGAYENADLPFEKIVEATMDHRTPGDTPFHQVMFVMLEEGTPELKLGDSVGTPSLLPLVLQKTT